MSLPENITKEHLIQAINKIDIEGIPKDVVSQYYDVIYNGKKYPPKLIISYANIFANGIELDRNTFPGGIGTPCFKLMEREGFTIDKKGMNNIKLYDIHGASTIENYRTLITPDDKYFYWDSKRFTRNEINDIVFWVNRTEKVVLYTRIDSKEVQPSFKDGRNLINDNGYNVSATAQDPSQFENFYRFKIIEKVQMPEGWNYSNLVPFNGQTMAIILYEPNFNEPEKKIEKINDLILVFKNNEDVTEILNETLTLLKGTKIKNKKQKTSLSQNIETKDMNILTAIKTKPFILLAGISGTGKSRLVRTLAYKTCNKDELRTDSKKPGNFELIPVRPNWHDSSELMGYVSRINGEKYISTAFLQFIAKAWRNLEVPFLLCLDEMNLAPVEQYFAEYLSIIETRQVQGEKIGTDYLISKSSLENHALYSQLLADLGLDENEFSDGISIPNNLVVIGTVNMDETTHSFSRKVLDRAMTFEMNNVDLTAGLDNTKNDWSYPGTFISSKEVIGDFTSGAEVVNEFAESKKVVDFLINLNTELEGTPFKIAYRVRDEFLIYCYYASLNQTNSNWLTNALDEMTSMKILSRIEGDETKTGSVLINLQRVLTADYKKSNAKLKEMEARLSTSGYTSFWS
jgi:5-methylcytosine-specific restriction protein B